MQPSSERALRIEQLLAHLRANTGAKFSAGDLALQFGLEKEFVVRLLAGVRVQPKPRPKAKDLAHKPFFTRVAHSVARSFAKWPLLFIFLSVVVYGLIVSVATAFGSWEDVSNGLLTVALLVVQSLIYFKVAKPWLAVKGAAILFGPSYVFLVLDVLFFPTKSSFGALPFLIVSFLSLLFLAAFYSTAFALVGVWGALNRQKREDARLTRQELLQRYFELEERLKHASAEYTPPPNILQRFIASYRASPYLWALFLGVFFTLLQIGASAYAGVDPYEPSPSSTRPALFFILVLPIDLLAFAGFLFMTYAAGTPKKGSLVAIISGLASDIGRILITHGNPHGRGVRLTVNDATFHTGPWIQMIVSLAAVAGFGAALGGAAIFGERGAHDKKLRANDEAALASELLSIQMRLMEQSTRVFVMVVDVAGSTAMKANADTLTAEYAFRLYQQWVARLVSMFRGTVQATAGDGAIIAFSSADDALRCALELQRDIDRFNREQNKLAMPFRVRIGLHAGNVTSDLGQVQFTRVIDVAAHIEKVAPIGGVALSEELISDSSVIPVRDGGEEVDGSRIYMVDPSAIEDAATPSVES